jgi:hypothetical protein
MTTQVTTQLDTDGLMDEVRRYLVIVEVFRSEGREPRWLPERPGAAGQPPSPGVSGP